MKIQQQLALLVAGLTLSGMLMAGTDDIRSLQNMERERAVMIDTFTSAEVDPVERARKLEFSSRRLRDMERMVIRDDRLLGSNTPVVRKAFQNYDLTFLVHASVEHNRHPVDYWLEQVGISTATIVSSHSGRQ